MVRRHVGGAPPPSVTVLLYGTVHGGAAAVIPLYKGIAWCIGYCIWYPIRVLHVNSMMGWWCMVNRNSSGCPSVPGIAWFDIAWRSITYRTVVQVLHGIAYGRAEGIPAVYQFPHCMA